MLNHACIYVCIYWWMLHKRYALLPWMRGENSKGIHTRLLLTVMPINNDTCLQPRPYHAISNSCDLSFLPTTSHQATTYCPTSSSPTKTQDNHIQQQEKEALWSENRRKWRKKAKASLNSISLIGECGGILSTKEERGPSRFRSTGWQSPLAIARDHQVPAVARGWHASPLFQQVPTLFIWFHQLSIAHEQP